MFHEKFKDLSYALAQGRKILRRDGLIRKSDFILLSWQDER
jgi:hypothetical protein